MSAGLSIFSFVLFLVEAPSCPCVLANPRQQEPALFVTSRAVPVINGGWPPIRALRSRSLKVRNKFYYLVTGRCTAVILVPQRATQVCALQTAYAQSLEGTPAHAWQGAYDVPVGQSWRLLSRGQELPQLRCSREPHICNASLVAQACRVQGP